MGPLRQRCRGRARDEPAASCIRIGLNMRRWLWIWGSKWVTYNRAFRLSLMSTRSVRSSWGHIPHCHWYAPRFKRWRDAALIKGLQLNKSLTDGSPSPSHDRSAHNCILTHILLDKMRPFRRPHFDVRFHKWKVLWFDSIFTESGIGSGNDLAPNRRQSIAWTNGHLVHRRIYARSGQMSHYSH